MTQEFSKDKFAQNAKIAVIDQRAAAPTGTVQSGDTWIYADNNGIVSSKSGSTAAQIIARGAASAGQIFVSSGANAGAWVGATAAAPAIIGSLLAQPTTPGTALIRVGGEAAQSAILSVYTTGDTNEWQIVRTLSQLYLDIANNDTSSGTFTTSLRLYPNSVATGPATNGGGTGSTLYPLWHDGNTGTTAGSARVNYATISTLPSWRITAATTTTAVASTKFRNIAFDTNVVLTDVTHSTSSSNWLVTIVRAGMYLVGACIQWPNSTTTSTRTMNILKNCTSVDNLDFTPANGNSLVYAYDTMYQAIEPTPTYNLSSLVRLIAGDTLSVQVYNGDAASMSMNSNYVSSDAHTYPVFWGQWMGA